MQRFQQVIVYEELAGADIRLLTPGSGLPPRVIPLFDAPEFFNEVLPALSPDGRWLAYQSTESADAEVYLRPFPDVSSLRRRSRSAVALRRYGRQTARRSTTVARQT